MSIKYGFFDSVNNDRLYSADDFNCFFKGMISDGVFRNYENELQVTPKSGLQIYVLAGRGICADRYIENTSAMTLTLESSNMLPRIDAVILKTDLDNRTCDITVKSGTPASTPTAPNLQNDNHAKELALAYITVGSNATTITSANITDKRGDSAVCGWVALTNTSTNITTYRNTVTTDNTVNSVNIGISSYTVADTLLVYKNGLLLNLLTEYTVSGTGSNAVINLTTTSGSGNVFSFVCIHNGIS